MNKVRSDKVLNLKLDILNGKDTKTAMIDNGYSETTAERGTANKVVQEALSQIKSDVIESGITPERLIEEIKWSIKEARKNYINAKTQRDKQQWYSRYQSSQDTLARHVLSTKQDINQRNTTVGDEGIIGKYMKHNRLEQSN